MGPETSLTLSVGTLIAIAGFIWKFSTQIAAISVKIDTLWDFHMKRGQIEGLHMGAMTRNSPLSLTQVARDWFTSLEADVKTWYRKTDKRVSDRDLFVLLEKEFGQRITDEICIPHQITREVCLAGAVLICRECDSE